MSIAIVINEQTGVQGKFYGYKVELHEVEEWNSEGGIVSTIGLGGDDKRFMAFEDAVKAGKELAEKLLEVKN